jgi:hypothetical protein
MLSSAVLCKTHVHISTIAYKQRNMEMGGELSKTVATFIVQKILLHDWMT